ncbi:NUDIX domain-containing protein [Paenibacillus sp. GCM10027627]|uniref:NUDIX domain-containing protein n=1 Tax=unclassified Paenibacillus TaxID=185978 RepID=UPI00362FC8B7
MENNKRDFISQSSNDIWREDTISSEQIFKGRVISLQVDTVSLPDGRSATREIVKHPGAAAVMALLDGKLLVVDQFRKPLDKCQVEIPAGKLDPGEDPMEAAARELEEETGFVAKSLKLVNSFYTSPGFADEKLYLYFADQLERGTQRLDEDEDVRVEAITVEEADELVAAGRISDAKTLLALYAWKLYERTGAI